LSCEMKAASGLRRNVTKNVGRAPMANGKLLK
jgi:hypothetical protein